MFLEVCRQAISLLSQKYKFDYEEALNLLGIPEMEPLPYRKTPISKKTVRKMKKMDIARVIDTDEEDI